MSLRYNDNSRRLNRATVFTGTAAYAQFCPDGGAVFVIGVYCMLWALFLAKQA